MITPSEQTSELSYDSNDNTITDNESEDENYEHPVPVATDISHVWFLNVIVYMFLFLCQFPPFKWDQYKNLRLQKKGLKIHYEHMSTPINPRDSFVWPYGHTDFGLRGLPILELKIIHSTTL